MNSGIFLPPNKIKTARIIRIHSDPPGILIKKILDYKVTLKKKYPEEISFCPMF